MGYYKHKEMELVCRRYGESDKYVCCGCIKNSYLRNMIMAHGHKGICSFCKKGMNTRKRTVLELEDLMKYIMPMIDNSYVSAEDNLPLDDETGKYMGITYDHYDFAHGPLAAMIGCDNPEVLDEIMNILEDEIRTPI